MTRYIGGCFCCGGHEGNFELYLPNGVCIHPRLAGAYFCESCEQEIRGSKERLEELIEKWCKTFEGYGYVSHTYVNPNLLKRQH